MGVNSPIMKIVYSLLIALVVLVLASCKKDSIHYADDFGDSRRAWQAFRDSAHNSYRYKVVSGSWVGTGLETIISVQAGKVVGRSFKYTARIKNAPIATVRERVENESQLNSHQEGAKTITLDEVYQEAKDNWLKKRDDADTYFEARNNGKISTAGYVPHGCADDCFTGITITLIEAI